MKHLFLLACFLLWSSSAFATSQTAQDSDNALPWSSEAPKYLYIVTRRYKTTAMT